MAGSGEDDVSTTLKWCSRGGEIGFYVKIEGCHFAEREQMQVIGRQQLNLFKVFSQNDGTEVCTNIVTREDSNNGTVLELNTLIAMHMSNGCRVEQRNCTGVQLNHATAGELITVTKVQLKNGTVLELNNNAVANLNDGTMVRQNNLTTGQLNNGTTVQWYSCIEHWCNHAAGHWFKDKSEKLINGATWLCYNSPIVQGHNVTMMHC